MYAKVLILLYNIKKRDIFLSKNRKKQIFHLVHLHFLVWRAGYENKDCRIASQVLNHFRGIGSNSNWGRESLKT